MNITVAIVGLGYVGLPLAVVFGRSMQAIGFDVNAQRIEQLQQGFDATLELDTDQLQAAKKLEFSCDPAVLAKADVIIVAVPTPIDSARNPDFGPLEAASRTVGKQLKLGMTVVFESTVYPGATEEVCVPILEAESGLTWRKDFHVGYSPERINPGDKQHTLEKIVKLVAGDDLATIDLLAELYGSVIEAGVYRASSIAVAEAAKVIENTQRDVNIALINELAMIFNRLDLDTVEVLEAAGTKWNFLPFRPGLVGGHCIGVDPYYLTYRAEQIGYHPKVITSGRRINDGMGKYIAEQTVKQMIAADAPVKGGRVLVAGFAFKEDCPDSRNSRVIDILDELNSYGIDTVVADPLVDPDQTYRESGVSMVDLSEVENVDAIILAVAHSEYRQMEPSDWLALTRGKPAVMIDVKAVTDRTAMKAKGFIVWRL